MSSSNGSALFSNGEYISIYDDVNDVFIKKDSMMDLSDYAFKNQYVDTSFDYYQTGRSGRWYGPTSDPFVYNNKLMLIQTGIVGITPLEKHSKYLADNIILKEE